MNPTTTPAREADLRDPQMPKAEPAESTQPAPLFAENDARQFHNRWNDVQAMFVDEPKRAVESADALVADVVRSLTESFTRTRADLDQRWKKGAEVSTEDLRQALRQYRAFFERLLAM